MKMRMKMSKLFRDLELDRKAVNVEARTVAVSFSSEEPVQRWFGNEVLDHSPKAVDLGRLLRVGSVLVDHQSRDLVGTVESASIGDDRKGRAVVRFGKSSRAEEIFQDVIDGIRKAISVGYRINTLKLEKSDKDTGVDTYRATKWTPHEISFVGVPADHTVGVGRGEDDEAGMEDVLIEANDQEQKAMKRKMSKLMEGMLRSRGIMVDDGGDPAAGGGGDPAPARAATPPATGTITADAAQQAQNAAVDRERTRCKSLAELGKVYEKHGGKELAQEMILSGRTPDDFKNTMLERIGTREIPNANIGLNQKELKRFSMMRLLNSMANRDDAVLRAAAAFEWECSAAALKAEKRDLRPGAAATIPQDITLAGFQRDLVGNMGQQRDLLVGTGTMGGYTVATDLVSFIELFRNRLAMTAAGAQMLTGLQGMIAIPTQTGGATAYWVAENGAPTESQPVFGQKTMSPKTVGAYVDMSRRLLIQSSIDVENFVKADLAKVLALAVDLAALSGPGTGNQPTGILTSTSIGSSTAGTNGAAPSWAQIVALETAVAAANADQGTMSYMVNSVTRGKLKTVQKGTNLPFIWEPDNSLNGYRSIVSNQLRSTLTKGTSTAICSEMLFGNFGDFIMGMWGGLDLMVDPYAGATAGTVRVIVLQDVDVLMRHPESFAVTPDLLTT